MNAAILVGTYYDVGLGACGQVNDDSEMVVALSGAVFSSL